MSLSTAKPNMTRGPPVSLTTWASVVIEKWQLAPPGAPALNNTIMANESLPTRCPTAASLPIGNQLEADSEYSMGETSLERYVYCCDPYGSSTIWHIPHPLTIERSPDAEEKIRRERCLKRYWKMTTQGRSGRCGVQWDLSSCKWVGKDRLRFDHSGGKLISTR